MPEVAGALIAEDLAVEIGGQTVFSGLTLRADPGSIVAITGPPGSGKSLLAQVFAGLLAPSHGRVLVGTRPLVEVEPESRPAFMPQDNGLLDVLTAAENVELVLQARAFDRAEIGRRAATWLEAVGLSQSANQLASELSGGQRQRVALARALALESRHLVLDEPTSELDAVNRDRVLRILRERASEGAAVVLVAHDPEVLAAGDDTVEMGRLARAARNQLASGRER